MENFDYHMVACFMMLLGVASFVVQKLALQTTKTNKK